MGLWPFGRRKETEDKNVDQLLAEASAASPPSVPYGETEPAPVGQTGDGGLLLPVADVFVITGRGLVVTGRVETGVATVGQQVHVVRDGAVVATTRINGIEQFRTVKDSATVGENVGLLLDAMSRDQVMSGDLIQG